MKKGYIGKEMSQLLNAVDVAGMYAVMYVLVSVAFLKQK